MTSRRTIEALRAGVPNSDAVVQLGCSHPAIEEQFRRLLSQTDAGIESDSQPKGILVSGDFGSGKSHLLQYFESVALDEQFVCSKIVISKETSLADPSRVFRAAMTEARVPGKLGPGLGNIAMSLKFQRPSYTEFFRWVDSAEAALVSQFPASLYLFEYGRDLELREEIIRFWSGDPLSNPRLKAKLREMGQLATYNIGRLPPQKELALQRFRFAIRLAGAAGYRGWVLLIDEVELIGQYGQKQRARAYRELARWLGATTEGGGTFPGLATVAAITSDFERNVLEKRDLEDIPNKLRATGREHDAELATFAERGMRIIGRDREPLSGLTPELVKKAHDQLRVIYSDAFQWEAPSVFDPGRVLLGSSVMRPLVRRWITEWDLRRLYPGIQPDIEETPLVPGTYAEDPDLEATDGE